MKFETFLINLKKNTDRLAFMSNQFQRIGIKYKIFEGIDGKKYDFTNDYDDLLSKEKNGRSLTRGHIGCSLSHKKIFEKMISEDIDYTLVIEDDVELPQNFKNIIDTELKKRESGITSWDYLSFNYPPTGIEAIKTRILSIKKTVGEMSQGKAFLLRLFVYCLKSVSIIFIFLLEGIRESLYKRISPQGKALKFYRPLYLTGCYLINRDGARKLLSVNKKIIYSADRLPNVARIRTGLKFYAFVPLITRQMNDFGNDTGL